MTSIAFKNSGNYTYKSTKNLAHVLQITPLSPQSKVLMSFATPAVSTHTLRAAQKDVHASSSYCCMLSTIFFLFYKTNVIGEILTVDPGIPVNEILKMAFKM